ncbi:MAG: hypothetical protein K5686_11620 [Lachnospiraceae bacterium]|nr:hypothetical protein [Lachnospiraceae bacterium]
MERSISDMKLDIVRWELEDAEEVYEQEYKQLCKEKPDRYGDGPFKIKKNSYKANFYKIICESILDTLNQSDGMIRNHWERTKAQKEKEQTEYNP